jgi:hypothetical protein
VQENFFLMPASGLLELVVEAEDMEAERGVVEGMLKREKALIKVRGVVVEVGRFGAMVRQ